MNDCNRCSSCGSVPIRDPIMCINKCPHCGRIWTDVYGEQFLQDYWNRPVKVNFD
jgi:hypothetical protein